VYEISEMEDQIGNQDDSFGFGPDSRAVFEAGTAYTFPDLERQITFSPLKLELI